MEQKNFGATIRHIREENCLLLRQVAAALEVDTALISKIERGERKAQKEQVAKLAEFFKINVDDLLVIWLSDKIVDMLVAEPLALKALKNSEKRINRK